MAQEDIKQGIETRTKLIYNLMSEGKREEALQQMRGLHGFIVQNSHNGDLAEDRTYIEKAINQLEASCGLTQTDFAATSTRATATAKSAATATDRSAVADLVKWASDTGLAEVASSSPTDRLPSFDSHQATASVRTFVVLVVVAVMAFALGVVVGRKTAPVASLASQTTSVGAPEGCTIQGTLNYVFKHINSAKPDAGADVYVLQGEKADATGTYEAFKAAAAMAYKSSVSDGQGSFRFVGLPPGTYTVLIRSSHAKESEPPAGEMYQKTVTVHENETVEVNHDLGIF